MNGRGRIAWNLRRLRTQRGVTQEALAVDAEVDRTSISGMENATVSASIDLLDRLASALAIDVAEFLELPDDQSAKPSTLKPGRKSR